MLYSYVYVVLGMFAAWLIWWILLLYNWLTRDKSFVFLMYQKKQRMKHWLFLGIIGILCLSLFLVRYKRRGIVLDMYSVWNSLRLLVNHLSWLDLLILVTLLILVIICWSLAMKCLFQHSKRCVLALYVYYFQYDNFRTYVCFKLVDFIGYYNAYLEKRVKIFTKNHLIGTITLDIWPTSTNLLEKNIFYFIIPYLWIFDYITQDGMISKVFVILPWYLLYAIIRKLVIWLDEFFVPEFQDISEKLYGLR